MIAVTEGCDSAVKVGMRSRISALPGKLLECSFLEERFEMQYLSRFIGLDIDAFRNGSQQLIGMSFFLDSLIKQRRLL